MPEQEEQKNQRRDVSALNLILSVISEVSCDIAGQPSVSINHDQDEQQVWSIHSRRFRSWIAEFVWDHADIVLYDQELNRILTVLEGRAWNNQQVDTQVCEAIEKDPLFEAIIIWINEKKQSFDGRSTKLLLELNKTAKKFGVDTQHQAWPKAPAQLSRRIRQLEQIFERVGISIEVGRRPGGERFIRLSKTDACDSEAETPTQVPPVDKLHHPITLTAPDASDGKADDIFSRVQQKSKKEDLE